MPSYKTGKMPELLTSSSNEKGVIVAQNIIRGIWNLAELLDSPDYDESAIVHILKYEEALISKLQSIAENLLDVFLDPLSGESSAEDEESVVI